MADDELENGRPRDHAAARPGRSPLGPSQAITLFMSLMLVGLLVCTSMPGAENVRMMALERPIESVERVFERNLWTEDAIESLPSWSRSVARVLAGSSAPAREDAIAAFEEVLGKKGYPRPEMSGGETVVDPALLDGLRARRACLLAFGDRVEEARGDLERLTAIGHQSFVDGLLRATSRVKSDDLRPFEAYDTALAGEDWIGARLRLWLANATGDRARADEIGLAIRERRDVVTHKVMLVASAKALLLALGLGVLFAWLARNRPAATISSAEIPPAWTFESGYAVCVRSAFTVLLVMLAVMQIDAWLGFYALNLWGSLLVSLPMLWLVRRRLLRPLGATFRSAFGLSSFPRPLAWIGFTLALFALEWLGSRVIVDILHSGGIRSHWSEQIDPIAVWAPKPIALLSAFDDCVWAPIVIELGLRGLLFLTLRRHYNAWQSALLSSLLFGAAQFYSLPALAAVTWQGFVFALAFERTRSLAPCMASHMLSNVIAAATTWVFWR